jgi:N-acetylmuramoyl-L-alanine amidase
MNTYKAFFRTYTLSSTMLLLFLFACSFAYAQDTARSTYRFKTVVIDAGHGGKDPGAHGGHAQEKTIALALAKKLRTALLAQIDGLEVVMTRTDDTFIPLNRRSEIANQHKGNLFISIHCNSSPERPGRRKGVMLLVYGFHRVQEQLEAIRENASIYQEKDYQKTYEKYDSNNPANRILLNAYMQKYRKQSIRFGDLLNQEFKNDGRASIGVKEQGLLVLAHSAMPEEDYLASDEGQDEIVKGIVRAVKNFKAETAVK